MLLKWSSRFSPALGEYYFIWVLFCSLKMKYLFFILNDFWLFLLKGLFFSTHAGYFLRNGPDIELVSAYRKLEVWGLSFSVSQHFCAYWQYFCQYGSLKMFWMFYVLYLKLFYSIFQLLCLHFFQIIYLVWIISSWVVKKVPL